MKHSVLIIFIILSFGGLAQSKKQTVTIKTPNTCDHCKVCETCGALLEHELVYVKGIKLAVYNQEAQTTTVTYKSNKISVDQIRKEIALLGFSADELPADPDGYKKRDGCCKSEE